MIAVPKEESQHPAGRRPDPLSSVWLLGPVALGITTLILVIVNLERLRSSQDVRRIVAATLIFALAPYVVGLAAVWSERYRAFGLALLVTAAIVVCGFAALVLLHLVSYWGLLGLVYLVGLGPLGFAHVSLAVAAARALPGAPSLRGRSAAPAAGVVVVIVYAFTAYETVQVMERRLDEQRQASVEIDPDSRAAKAADALRTCFDLIRQFVAVPNRHWPRTVADLGSGELRCLSDEQINPSDQAYQIHVAAAPTPHRAAFTACVTWVRKNEGRAVFAAVQDERARSFTSMGHGRTPAAACVDSYERDRLRQLRWCLWEWGSTHGGRYPQTLDALIAATTCAIAARDAARDRAYTYIPGPADAESLVTSFVMIEAPASAASRPTFVREGRARRLDETGVIHATVEPRLPTLHDRDDDVEANLHAGKENLRHELESRD